MNENCNLNIFEQTAKTSEPMKELVSKKFLIFKQYQVNFKDIKYLFQLWEKYESMFPIVGFIAHQMLSIMGFQIEMGRIFSLINKLNNLKRCHLQINTFKKLILVSKN
jgi:hypothetical protein